MNTATTLIIERPTESVTVKLRRPMTLHEIREVCRTDRGETPQIISLSGTTARVTFVGIKHR